MTGPILGVIVAAAAVAGFALLAIRRSGELRPPRVAVLIYHRVLDRDAPMREADREDWGCTVFADEFRDHLRALAEAGYTAIKPDQYHAFLTRGTPLPERPVLITFDDGWRSVYEHALPALREAEMTATIFMNTDADNENFRGGDPVDGAMTDDMVRAWHEAGMVIGSHGATHTYFTLLDDAALRDELTATRRHLEHVTGAPVTALAAPGGQADARVAALAKTAGYQLFFAGGSGTIGRESEPMNLPRLGVERGVTGRQLVANLTPMAILQHRSIQAAKRLPTRLFGARTMNAVRRRAIDAGLGWMFRVRFLKRAAVGVVMIAVFLVAWLVAR